ncbi:hypothetical protein WICMUC_002542 [Wickerhamomyces mucosus]|uniref:thioredoxin-dependent peroxiredoxin n=1 Tax=Wickerhamomyces mucosus TaxID=1378264 RepID=A0A9P8PQK4_9ASCO|nr:hypothetical protein WICMUC_002542 [Wickerhamomyces mucosus]
MVELRRSARVKAATSGTKIESLDSAKISKPKPSKNNDVKKNNNNDNKSASSSSKTSESIKDEEVPKKELEIGDEIPDLILLNQDDQSLSLKELAKNNKLILIFSYPKASTPGCTRQACGYRDNFNSIKDKALILGLSADSPSAQLKFKSKQNLQYDLLSDPKKELISILGAKKHPSGIKRSHWVFKDGKLIKKNIQISPEISVKRGKEEILELTE